MAAPTGLAELLDKHEQFRRQWRKTWAPTSFKDQSGESLNRQIELCAGFSSAIYVRDGGSEFEAEASAKTLLKVHKGKKKKQLPNSCNDLAYIESAEVVVGWSAAANSLCRMAAVVVMTRSAQKRPQRHLYFVYKGSDTAVDWLANLDFGPVPTSVAGVEVMNGINGAWHCSQGSVVSCIKQALSRGDLAGVFFTGHSKGAGVASLAHLECCQKFPKLQNRMYCIGFSSPPVFYVDRSKFGNGQMARFDDLSVNISVEHDIVPRINMPDFRMEALKSYLMSRAPAPIAKIAQWPVNLLARLKETWTRKLQDEHLRHLDHLACLCVATAVLGDQVWQQSWTWKVLKSSEDKRAFLNQPWPFKGLPTAIAIDDHTWLPKGLGPSWQTDHCHRDCDLMGLDGEADVWCRYCMEGDPMQTFYDCRACRMTWCRRCADDPQSHRCGKDWILERSRRVTSDFVEPLHNPDVEGSFAAQTLIFVGKVGELFKSPNLGKKLGPSAPAAARFLQYRKKYAEDFDTLIKAVKSSLEELATRKSPLTTAAVSSIAKNVVASLSPRTVLMIWDFMTLAGNSKPVGELDRAAVVNFVAEVLAQSFVDYLSQTGQLPAKLLGGQVSGLLERAGFGKQMQDFARKFVHESTEQLQRILLTNFMSVLMQKEQSSRGHESRRRHCERALLAMRVLGLTGVALENLEQVKIQANFKSLVSASSHQQGDRQQRAHRNTIYMWARQVLMDFLTSLKGQEGQENLLCLLNMIQPRRAKL